MADATATADPATASLGMFGDASYWRLPDGKSTIVGGVPVFDEHDEYDQRKTVTDGNGTEVPNPNLNKLIRRFDATRLQTIADNCNRRYQTTGDACPVTLGHTRPGEPEKNQPEICGYALNFRLGHYGPAKKLAILADFYVFPSYWGEFLKHPRRSVELFPRDQVFDPIAVLKRTPERDLGLITPYVGTDGATLSPSIQHAAAYRQVTRYQRSGDLSGEPIRYSITEHEGNGAMDEKQAAEEFAKKVIAAVPHMRHRAKAYEAKCGEKLMGGDGEASLKDQYQARRFYKGYYLKHSAKIRNAKKHYEAEEGAEKDGEADHFEADDELAPQEEAQAESYYRHFSKHPGIRYAMGLDDDMKAEEPAAPAAPAAAAAPETPAPAAAAPPAPAPAAGGAEMSSMAEHKVQPPEMPLDNKHGFTEEQYFRHRYHKDPVFKHMYDKAHAEHAAAQQVAPPPATPPAAPPPAAAPAQFDAGAAGGAPSATNVAIPPAVPAPAEQHAKRDQAIVPAVGGDVIHYARQLQELQAQVSELAKSNQTMADRWNTSRGELYVVGLEAEGFNFGNRRDQKIEQFAKLGDDVKRGELAAEIRETWARDGAPTTSQPMHLRVVADPDGVASVGRRGEAQRFSKEDAQAATVLAQSDPNYNTDPQGAYTRAVEQIKAKRSEQRKTA